AFGAHVNTSPPGVVCTRPGTLQAGSNVLEVTIRGRGGHGSQPQSAVDPVPVLAELVTALQNMVSRRIDAFDPIVMSVTQLRAGDAINVIPASASLAATVRTLSESSLETVRQRSEQLAEGIAAAHGCTAEVTFEVQYPVTVNDAAETAWALERLEGLLGGERGKVLPQPIMPSEDFSFVLRQVPGTYLMLGAGRTDVPADRQGDNHSPLRHLRRLRPRRSGRGPRPPGPRTAESRRLTPSRSPDHVCSAPPAPPPAPRRAIVSAP